MSWSPFAREDGCRQHNAAVSPPLSLGRYPVRRRLGAGAFATVWLAHDEQLDSPVAIKVLADNWAGDDHVRRRFVEEGRFLRKVESPYVVPVYDAGESEDGRPSLVMAFADQGTLAEWLARESLPRAQALQVITEVGAGLAALHARGVLHRDVKPGNVLLRSVDGRVRAMVADLGLGKELDMSSRLTVIAGDPVVRRAGAGPRRGADARADRFSLAALAYLLLAGRPAWSTSRSPPPRSPRRCRRWGTGSARGDRGRGGADWRPTATSETRWRSSPPRCSHRRGSAARAAESAPTQAGAAARRWDRGGPASGHEHLGRGGVGARGDRGARGVGAQRGAGARGPRRLGYGAGWSRRPPWRSAWPPAGGWPSWCSPTPAGSTRGPSRSRCRGRGPGRCRTAAGRPPAGGRSRARVGHGRGLARDGYGAFLVGCSRQRPPGRAARSRPVHGPGRAHAGLPRTGDDLLTVVHTGCPGAAPVESWSGSGRSPPTSCCGCRSAARTAEPQPGAGQRHAPQHI